MNKFSRSLTRFALLWLSVLPLAFGLKAQQGHIYNQFFMNPYMYNPAYAGVDGHGVIFAMYKQQWSKIPDGPSIAHASYHLPLKGGIGFGVTVFNESLGAINTSAGKVTGSYLINIDRKHFLRLGMSLGMGSNQATLPEDANDDPAFRGESSSYLIGDFGATYHFNHFNVGFSIPNLFTPEVISEEKFSAIVVNPLDRMLFKMNYRGHISHEIAVEPQILYRYSNLLPSQFEVATIVHLMHVAWVGGTYRQYAGFVALMGAKVKHKFAVGVAFELGNSDYNSLTGSSFEINVGMHMGGQNEKKLGHVDHHKTWFSTHSDELVAKAEAKARRDSLLAAQQDQLAIVQENLPVPVPVTKKPNAWTISVNNLERTTDAGVKEIAYGTPPVRGEGSSWAISPATANFEERDRTDGRREVAVKWVRLGAAGKMEESIVWTLIGEPIAETKPVETKPIETKPVPAETKPVVTNETKPMVPTDTRTYSQIATTNVPLVVTKGNNILELPAGNYLVGGVYDDFDEAERRSDQMFHKGFRDVRVGYVSARKHYYVILKSYATIEQAQQDKGKVQSGSGLTDVWVLKVNE